MNLHIKERYNTYTRPFGPIKVAIASLISNLFTHGLHSVRSRAFANWLTTLSPHFKAHENTTIVPKLVSQASGIILDVGAGSGNQMHRFDQAKISRLYGVEPNIFLLPVLQDRAKECGLENVFVPVVCGIEDDDVLQSCGLCEESVDCIVCMQTLCSVGDPAVAIRRLHRLLRPGGKFVFWEHQKSKDLVTRMVQRFWNFCWEPLCGCSLIGETEKIVLRDRDLWEIEEFGREEEPWGLLPRVWGVLVKR